MGRSAAGALGGWCRLPFAVTGAAASWGMLGIYPSLFPQLVGRETGIHRQGFTSGSSAR
ncbi:hypothetical protein [Segeticoccus rhizosphaerae]|uniref:hypothetical protein n=1 Tax=Segeticoccus rhizosphaerae TaxID=1104777 RepID=UPI001390355E|nr:hypothetical protein [Ornithinicoccus soli]